MDLKDNPVAFQTDTFKDLVDHPTDSPSNSRSNTQKLYPSTKSSSISQILLLNLNSYHTPIELTNHSRSCTQHYTTSCPTQSSAISIEYAKELTPATSVEPNNSSSQPRFPITLTQLSFSKISSISSNNLNHWARLRAALPSTLKSLSGRLNLSSLSSISGLVKPDTTTVSYTVETKAVVHANAKNFTEDILLNLLSKTYEDNNVFGTMDVLHQAFPADVDDVALDIYLSHSSGSPLRLYTVDKSVTDRNGMEGRNEDDTVIIFEHVNKSSIDSDVVFSSGGSDRKSRYSSANYYSPTKSSNSRTTISNSLSKPMQLIRSFSANAIEKEKEEKDFLTSGCFKISPLPHNQCHITLIAEVKMLSNAKRSLTEVNNIIESVISIVKLAKDFCYRGEEVDAAYAAEFMKSMPFAPHLTTQEDNMISKKIKKALSSTSSAPYKIYKGVVVEDVEKYRKTTAVIHASIEQAFSFAWLCSSNAQMELHTKENGDVAMHVTTLPDSRSQFFFQVLKFSQPYVNRVYESWMTWKIVNDFEGRGNRAIILAFAPKDEYINPVNPVVLPQNLQGLHRAINSGVHVYEEIAPFVTKATFMHHFDFGGILPEALIDKYATRSLEGACLRLQALFEKKGAAVDAEIREQFVKNLTMPGPLNDEQLKIIENGCAMAQAYEDSTIAKTQLFSPSCFVQMETKLMRTMSQVATGKVSADIDASPATIAAFLMDHCASVRAADRPSTKSIARMEVSRRSAYDLTLASIKKLPWPLYPREFVFRQVLQLKEDGTILIATYPSNEVVDYGFNTNLLVRATNETLYTITPYYSKPSGLSQDRSKFVVIQNVDALAGYFPQALLNFGKTSLAVYMREFFQRDEAVDASDRAIVASEVTSLTPHLYTLEESDVVNRGTAKLTQAAKGFKVQTSHDDALVKTSSVRIGRRRPSALFSLNPTVSAARGVALFSEFIVDTTVEEIIAYIFCVKSRSETKAFFDNEGGGEIDVQTINPHTQVVHTMAKYQYSSDATNLKAKLIRRSFEFRTKMVWKHVRNSKDDYHIIVSEPLEAAKEPKARKARTTSFFGGGQKKSRVAPGVGVGLGLGIGTGVGIGGGGGAGGIGGRARLGTGSVDETLLRTASEKISSSSESVGDRRRTAKIASEQFAYVRLDPIDNVTNVGIPQTTVRFYSKTQLGGYVLVSDADAISIARHTRLASRLRLYFDKSKEVDSANRLKFVKMVEDNEEGVYTESESAMLKEGVDRFNEFDSNSGKRQVLSHPLTKNFVGFKKGDPKCYRMSVSTVRGSPAEVLAYNWAYNTGRSFAKASLSKQVIEDVNPHNKLVYIVRSVVVPFKNRDLVVRFLWKRLDKKEGKGFAFVYHPTSHPSHPANTNGLVRAQYPTTVIMKQITSNETQVEFLIQPDVGLNRRKLTATLLYQMTVRQFANDRDMRHAAEMQQYFQEIRSLDVLDDKDGIAIGESLAMCRAGKKSAQDLIRRHASLVELSKTHDFFEPLLVCIAAIDLSIPINFSSKDSLFRRRKLKLMTESDGKQLASLLKKLLLTSLNEEIAVLRFIEIVPAMGAFAQLHPFFVALIGKMSYRLVSEHTRGKVFASFSKALFSLSDVGTDVFTAVIYYMSGFHEIAISLMAFIVLSLLLQLYVVVFNHSKNWRVMVRELCYCVTFTRSGFLHYRLLKNQPQAGHEELDVLVDSTLHSLIEVCAEAIPGAIIQAFALLTATSEGSADDRLKYLSIGISIAVVTFSINYVSIRKETDVTCRSTMKVFYGFIPGSGYKSIIVTLCMRMMSLAQFCCRIGFLSMIATNGLLALFTFTEIALYFTQKAIRNDLRHWLLLTGFRSLFFSGVTRIFVFEIVAATSYIGGRHPYECGGIGWLLIHVCTHLSLLLAIFNLDFPNIVWDISHLQTIAVILVTVWWLSFALMLKFGEKKYRHTFYSTLTAKQFSKFLFETGDDETKAQVFSKHFALVEGFQNEIKLWLDNGWKEWVEEDNHRHQWFNEQWIAKIPKHLIPKLATTMKGVKEEVERRSSKSSVRKTLRKVRSGLGLAKEKYLVEGDEAAYLNMG